MVTLFSALSHDLFIISPRYTILEPKETSFYLMICHYYHPLLQAPITSPHFATMLLWYSINHLINRFSTLTLQRNFFYTTFTSYSPSLNRSFYHLQMQALISTSSTRIRHFYLYLSQQHVESYLSQYNNFCCLSILAAIKVLLLQICFSHYHLLGTDTTLEQTETSLHLISCIITSVLFLTTERTLHSHSSV